MDNIKRHMIGVATTARGYKFVIYDLRSCKRQNCWDLRATGKRRCQQKEMYCREINTHDERWLCIADDTRITVFRTTLTEEEKEVGVVSTHGNEEI